MSNKVKVVGLTGGIGTGKSTAAEYFKKNGEEINIMLDLFGGNNNAGKAVVGVFFDSFLSNILGSKAVFFK